jgi:hypothetical protein
MYGVPLGFANLDSELLAKSQYASGSSCDWQIRLSISIISFCRGAHIELTPNTTLQFVKSSHNVVFELQNLKTLKIRPRFSTYSLCFTLKLCVSQYLTFIHIQTPYLVSSLPLTERRGGTARGTRPQF